MYRVLLVDDEILVREAISENINWNGLGFQLVKVCENGKEAIEYLAEEEVELVLTDIYMPFVDGMKLSKYVYENHPRTKIIIFSGYGEFEYAKQAIKYKVSEYLLKPVTARELSDVLSNTYQKLENERQEEQQFKKMSSGYKKYTRNEAVIKSRTMSNFVKGTKDIKESMAELKDMNIHVAGDSYKVAILDIDIYSDLYDITESEKKESSLMAFAVENISNEIVTNHNCGFSFLDDDNRVCILFYTKRCGEFRAQVMKVCESIQVKIFDFMKLQVSVCIGQETTNLEELHVSYESASNLLSCRYTVGGNMLLDSDDIKKDQWEAAVDIEYCTKTLSDAIKVKDRSRVEEALGLIHQEISARYISRSKAVAYLHQVLRVICETANNMSIDMKLEDTVITKVSKAGSLQKAMGAVKEYAQFAMKQMEEVSQSSGDYQASLAVEYLRENFANADLNLNNICTYLGISTSHFSNIFKESTGATFTEVLTNIRIEKAKHLLKETSLKNYEIAEKVGFSDPHYFSITFKKITGMTPKEFVRESN